MGLHLRRFVRENRALYYGELDRPTMRLLEELADRVREFSKPWSGSTTDPSATSVWEIAASRWTIEAPVEDLADCLGVTRDRVQVGMRRLRAAGHIESAVPHTYGRTTTRIVFHPRARQQFLATRRTAILHVHARVDVEGMSTTAAAIVDGLIDAWRETHVPTVRGRELVGARIPDDTVADALPGVVAGHLGDTAAQFEVTSVAPELPAGMTEELWGDPAAPEPTTDAVADAAIAALTAYWQGRELVHPRVVAQKIAGVLTKAGMTHSELAEAVIAGAFDGVEICRPSDVTVAALEPVLDPERAAEARRAAVARERREARAREAAAWDAVGDAYATGDQERIDAALEAVDAATAIEIATAVPAERPAGHDRAVRMAAAPALLPDHAADAVAAEPVVEDPPAWSEVEPPTVVAPVRAAA